MFSFCVYLDVAMITSVAFDTCAWMHFTTSHPPNSNCQELFQSKQRGPTISKEHRNFKEICATTIR